MVRPRLGDSGFSARPGRPRTARHFLRRPGAPGSALAGAQALGTLPPQGLMMPARVPVLLTVPHLNRTASPYRETMAMARYLAGSDFRLTICALREKGFQET